MTSIEESVSNIKDSLKNIDISNGDALYIIDNAENVIAYINEDGVHSTDFIIDNVSSNYSNYLSLLEKFEEQISQVSNLTTENNNIKENLQTLIASVDERLKNINGEDSDAFFFIDNAENVIAYIDDQGIHTIGVHVTEEGINTDSVLNIKNSSGEIIAKIDSNGVSSSNFLIENNEGTITHNILTILTNLNSSIDTLNTNINTVTGLVNEEIQNRTEADSALESDIEDINQKIQYLDGSENDKLFIVDSQDNTVGYFNEDGLHVTDIKVYGVKELEDGEYGLVEGDLTNVAPASVGYHIKDLQNRMLDKTTQIASINEKLNSLSNVMQFKGAVTSLPSDLTSYNSGDVIVVTSNGKEFVLVEDSGEKEWIEFGYSDYTALALSNLQSVVGREGGLDSGESSHDVRLDSLEDWKDLDFTPWKTSVSGQVETNKNNIFTNSGNIQTVYNILGESTYTDGQDHKTRIDNLKGVIGAESLAEGENSHDARLDSLENWKDSDFTSWQTSASEQIETNKNNIDILSQSINYRGVFDLIENIPSPSLGDIAIVNDILYIYNYESGGQTATWQVFEGISRQLYNINSSDDDSFYIIDSKGNVIAYFNEQGLSTTNIKIQSNLTLSGFVDRTQMLVGIEETSYTWEINE